MQSKTLQLLCNQARRFGSVWQAIRYLKVREMLVGMRKNEDVFLHFILNYILYCINSLSSYIKATCIKAEFSFPVKTYINVCPLPLLSRHQNVQQTFNVTTQNTIHKLECTHTHTS